MTPLFELCIQLSTLIIGICTTSIALGMTMLMQGSILRSIARLMSLALALFTIGVFVSIYTQTLTLTHSILISFGFAMIVVTLRKLRSLST